MIRANDDTVLVHPHDHPGDIGSPCVVDGACHPLIVGASLGILVSTHQPSRRHHDEAGQRIAWGIVEIVLFGIGARDGANLVR